MTFLFGFAFKFCPVAVIPVQPVSHFAVYAVACIVLVWPPDLDDTFDGDCFVFLSFGFYFVLCDDILFFVFFFTFFYAFCLCIFFFFIFLFLFFFYRNYFVFRFLSFFFIDFFSFYFFAVL